MTPSGAELRRVRSLIADLDAVVWEADARSLRFTFVSEGASDILGWAPSEFLSEPGFWADHIHDEDRERVVAAFVDAATEGDRFDQEYRFLAADGTEVWVRDLGHVVKDVDGNPALIRGLMTEVTKRKILEEERREAEERFRRVVERLPGIVYIEALDPDVTRPAPMLYVSPQVEPILGFTVWEWLDDPVAWSRQVHPDDRPQRRAAFAAAAKGGETFGAEYRMFARDGHVVWFRDEAVLVRDDADRPLFWQGILLDVTERHVVEERALLFEERSREAEARARTLVDHLPAIVYSEPVLGNDVEQLFINPRVEELLGISSADWEADPSVWQERMHPEDRERVLATNARTEETGEPFIEEYRMIALDGTVRWFHDEAVLVRDDEGRPIHWEGVMVDVTELKEARSRLSEAEARYRALVEQNPTITYIDPLEPDEPTVYISPQTTAVLGYPPQAWYDDPDLWTKLVHPEDRPVREQETEEGEPTTSVYRLIAADGRVVWVHDVARLIRDTQGAPRYWQGVMVDVTAQHRAEELIEDLEAERQLSERLLEADELKNTFLQTVSHDIRTPLAAILGLAVTMEREDLELSETEHRDMARRIALNARKLDHLVTDFLDLDRLSRGIVEPEMEPVDVGTLVRELVAGSELVAGRRLQLDTAPLVIPADPRMVERIVENLLGNTVKHTPGDSRIWVRVERVDDAVLIAIEDDGPGVPPQERDQIFEAFAQGTATGGGTGVGLALVARFAELHDGRAWVEERKGGGASFRVLLSDHPSRSQPTVDLTEEGEGVVDLGPDYPAPTSSEDSQA